MNILDWCGRGLLGEHCIPRPLDALRRSLFLFWNLCEESCFWNHVFGIQLFWSFGLIYHLQFPKLQHQKQYWDSISSLHYAWWRTMIIFCQNTLVSPSCCRRHVCSFFVHLWNMNQGWNAHHEIGHHGKDEAQGAMLIHGFGGNFFSLQMMSDIPNICLYCTKNGQNGTGRTDDRHIDWHTWIYLKNRLAEIRVSYDVIWF